MRARPGEVGGKHILVNGYRNALAASPHFRDEVRDLGLVCVAKLSEVLAISGSPGAWGAAGGQPGRKEIFDFRDWAVQARGRGGQRKVEAQGTVLVLEFFGAAC